MTSDERFEKWYATTGYDRHSGNYETHKQDMREKATLREGWNARGESERARVREIADRIEQAVRTWRRDRGTARVVDALDDKVLDLMKELRADE